MALLVYMTQNHTYNAERTKKWRCHLYMTQMTQNMLIMTLVLMYDKITLTDDDPKIYL